MSAHLRYCAWENPLAMPTGLVAIRYDLRRVAAVCGRPPGVAPSIHEFRVHGTVSPKRVMGAVGGYNGTRTKLGWMETMSRLGFTPAKRDVDTSYKRVVADIRRVALQVGDPTVLPSWREYERLGRWCGKTAMRHVGVTTWRAVAAQLRLAFHDG